MVKPGIDFFGVLLIHFIFVNEIIPASQVRAKFCTFACGSWSGIFLQLQRQKTLTYSLFGKDQHPVHRVDA
jgi:hypothetical protein